MLTNSRQALSSLSWKKIVSLNILCKATILTIYKCEQLVVCCKFQNWSQRPTKGKATALRIRETNMEACIHVYILTCMHARQQDMSGVFFFKQIDTKDY